MPLHDRPGIRTSTVSPSRKAARGYLSAAGPGFSGKPSQRDPGAVRTTIERQTAGIEYQHFIARKLQVENRCILFVHQPDLNGLKKSHILAEWVRHPVLIRYHHLVDLSR